MSASLVGSEMCIRDSGKHPESSLRASREHSASSSGRTGANQPWHTRPSGCLLYTSDAADDM
eukprot:11964117-Alexandrium_andersonii.AAC.1